MTCLLRQFWQFRKISNQDFMTLRNRNRIATVLLSAALVFVGLASPVFALGGDAVSETGGRLERNTIMVHGTKGNTCTGTVLSPTVVITAAHCVTGSSQYAVSYREGDSPVLQEVREVARHPNFKASSTVSVDVALIRMRLPLPPRFSPVTLDDAGNGADDNGVGSQQTIAGFGLSREGDEKTLGTLRVAQVTVLPRFYPRFFRLGRNGSDLLICKGDSGGPVLNEGLFGLTLTGVIYASEKSTNGRQCGDKAQAVRIAPQRRWIDGVMAKWAN
jgi:secreted trypsin-like serine protease